MESLTLSQFVVAMISVFAGATVSSTVGFGIGMVGLPISLTVLEPQTAVMVSNGGAALLSSLIVYQNRAHLRARESVPIALAGLVGALVGAYVLSLGDDRVLKISIVALIMALTAASLFKIRSAVPKPHLVGPMAGFLAALMLGSLGIGAPILVIFVLTLGWHRDRVRGTLSLFLLFIMLASLVGYAANGLYTSERATLTAAVLGPVLIGFWLGSRIAHRMNERVFRKAAIFVIVGTSLAVLAREVAQLV